MLSFCTDKPENVSLTVNISNNKVCADVVVNFTCTAEAANPAPHTYALFENEIAVVQNMESAGVWIRRLNTAGEATYRCEARNSIGAAAISLSLLKVSLRTNVSVMALQVYINYFIYLKRVASMLADA